MLAVNVGNTRLALGIFKLGTLEAVLRFGVDQRQDWQGKIQDAWSRIGDPEAAIVGASVNAPLVEAVEHAVTQVTGRAVQWVGKEIDLPIEVKTTNIAETGVDRVLNIAAAYEQMGKACVVADAGTALTVDVCDDTGAFLGGAIAPGATLMLQSLHEKTARLPEIPLARPESAIGRDTRQAMLTGVWSGLRGMVKELVEGYATELGQWPDLIATGGDAEALFGGWELVHAVAPDLTMYGIALAYANHQIKAGAEE